MANPQTIRRLVIATAIAALVFLAFQRLGPEPQVAADGALARAWGALKAEARPTVFDKEGLCPRTAATAVGARGGSARCVRRGEQLVLEGQGGAKLANARIASVRISGAESLIGPLAAVALVLALRLPAIGLFLAVLLGAVASFGPVEGARLTAVDVLWPTVTSVDNLLILLFTATMLGMVHVSMATGGFADLATKIVSGASGDAERSKRRTRVATWALGLVVFFDDYANSLVVGSSMRPLADSTGVSRAKLAYLVDATSAAVAGVAIVSTWVGFEVGLIQDQIHHFSGVGEAGYGVFLAAIPFRFYCLLTIFFAGLVAWSGRDYGPMARAKSQPAVVEGTSSARDAKWFDAVIPVLSVVAVVFGLNLWLGRAHEGGVLQRFVAGAEAGGLKTLAWAGVTGSLVAVGLAVGRRLLPVGTATRVWLVGVWKMVPVLLILLAAMSMRVVCDKAGTPGYLAELIRGVATMWVPLASFLVSALVAFMTGSSWATMGIMLPIVVPLAAADPGPQGIWLLAATAAVLDGAIFGDHCSPISDTTVMSSAAAGCPHDEHVITQLPYALTVMLAAGLSGYVAVSLGWWGATAGLALGAVALTVTLFTVGASSAEAPSSRP